MKYLVILFSLLSTMTAMTAHAKEPPFDLNTLDGRFVRRAVLDNGMVVLLREDHSAPVASVQMWVKTGSIHEGAQMGAGLSHILEHMLFKGTEKRTVGQIAQQVADVGGHMNAYTSQERTVYHIDVAVDGGLPGTTRGLDTAMEVLADAIMNSTLPEDEYLKEQQVILREMAMGRDNPEIMTTRLLFGTAFTIHPYRHPVIGYEEIYRRLTREDAFRYYKARYSPDNMVFVIVGDFDAVKVEARARELFKDFKRTPLSPVYVPQEPQQLGRREAHEERPVNLSRLYFAWHICDARHPDAPALDLLAYIAGHGKSSRLYQQLRDRKGLVQSVRVSAWTPGQPGLFYVGTVLDPAKRAATEKETLAEIKKLGTHPVSPAELKKAKQIALATQLSSLKTMEGQASDIGMNETVAGDLGFTRRYLAQVEALAPGDLQAVARKYFRDDNLTVVSVNPPGTLGKPARAKAERAVFDVKKFTLPNGLCVLVREDHRLPFVNFYAACKGGLLAETDANNGVSALMAKLLLKGTRTRTAEQIADEIESGGGSIAATGGNNSIGVSIEVLKTDVSKAVNVLADVLLRASFPEDAFEREKQIQIGAIKTENEQPTGLASKLVRRALFGRHPYHMTGNGAETSVARLQRADVVAFRDRFVVPNNMVIAVCGDVRAADVRHAIEKHFGRLPRAQNDPLAGRAAAAPLTATVRVENVAPRQQTVIFIGYQGVSVSSPDRFAMEVLDEGLSGLSSPLFRRLRDELALCYYTGASQLVGLDPGYFLFYIGTEPAKAKLAEAELMKEIGRIRQTGLSAEELARAKAKLISEKKISMQSNASLATQIALDELYGLGYKFSLDFEKHYSAVTAEDIRRAAHKYFGDAAAIAIVRPPEKQK
ncbi:MAG: insulinase family protein [Verrucomicrobiae bacterium]|nr:insulinase family protein [Verrucomicrobiae bacterium]